ncbi:MAG: protein-disulfide reductase DsbD domain-containing protein, partial [Polaribacter sp.]
MKNFLSFLALFLTLSIFSQTEQNPVVWKSEIKKISETEYDAIFKANILEDWHLYSQYNPDGASLPLEILVPEGETGYTLVGKAKESKTHKEFTETWGKDEIFFKNKAIITQRIQLTTPNISGIKIELTGQVCKQACLQVDESFSFSLNGKKATKEVVVLDDKSKALSKKLKLDLKNTKFLSHPSNGSSGSGGSLLNIFILGFFGGLLALLTPCVFPMIPLTVSFFTKQSQSKSKGI